MNLTQMRVTTTKSIIGENVLGTKVKYEQAQEYNLAHFPIAPHSLWGYLCLVHEGENIPAYKFYSNSYYPKDLVFNKVIENKHQDKVLFKPKFGNFEPATGYIRIFFDNNTQQTTLICNYDYTAEEKEYTITPKLKTRYRSIDDL